jgi:alkylation response protein AidB-like acyl-CoA dehydrogenase
MDFSLSEEQRLLRDSVGRYVADHCSVERHRRLLQSDPGFDPAAWRNFAELGWLCLPFAEEQGGLGGSATDIMVIAESMGYGVVREPFLHTVVVCGGFLRLGGSEAQQARYIPSLMDGSRQWAFAFAELHSGYDMAAIESSARADGVEYILAGSKMTVLNGHCADELIVTAKVAGSEAPALFVVDASLPGVSRETFTAVDGSRGAAVTLQQVRVSADCMIGAAEASSALIETVIDQAIVAMGAEALGSTQKLLDTTVEYTKTREQFGQPISKFQALQHRMADMYLKVEELRSLLFNAAIQLEEGSAEAAGACSALKVKLAEVGRFVSHEAVQLHGGIGMTDELIVGHLLKRLLLLSKLFGDEDYHLQRYTRLRREAAA